MKNQMIFNKPSMKKLLIPYKKLKKKTDIYQKIKLKIAQLYDK